jgi:hypothetical protein
VRYRMMRALCVYYEADGESTDRSHFCWVTGMAEVMEQARTYGDIDTAFAIHVQVHAWFVLCWMIAAVAELLVLLHE